MQQNTRLMYVHEGQQARSINPCPKCRTEMRDFEGDDVAGKFFQGLRCPKCSWFKGFRLAGSGRGGPIRGRPGGESPFEGRIRLPRDGGDRF